MLGSSVQETLCSHACGPPRLPQTCVPRMERPTLVGFQAGAAGHFLVAFALPNAFAFFLMGVWLMTSAALASWCSAATILEHWTAIGRCWHGCPCESKPVPSQQQNWKQQLRPRSSSRQCSIILGTGTHSSNIMAHGIMRRSKIRL